MEVKSGCTRKRSANPQISKASAVFFVRVFAKKGILRTNLSNTRDGELLEPSFCGSRSIISTLSSSCILLRLKSSICLPYFKKKLPHNMEIAYDNSMRKYKEYNLAESSKC